MCSPAQADTPDWKSLCAFVPLRQLLSWQKPPLTEPAVKLYYHWHVLQCFCFSLPFAYNSQNLNYHHTSHPGHCRAMSADISKTHHCNKHVFNFFFSPFVAPAGKSPALLSEGTYSQPLTCVSVFDLQRRSLTWTLCVFMHYTASAARVASCCWYSDTKTHTHTEQNEFLLPYKSAAWPMCPNS